MRACFLFLYKLRIKVLPITTQNVFSRSEPSERLSRAWILHRHIGHAFLLSVISSGRGPCWLEFFTWSHGVSPGEQLLSRDWEQQTSRAQSSQDKKEKFYEWIFGLNSETNCFHPLIPSPVWSAIGRQHHMLFCFKAYTVSSRMAPHPFGMLTPNWHENWVFSKPSRYISNLSKCALLLLGGGVC